MTGATAGLTTEYEPSLYYFDSKLYASDISGLFIFSKSLECAVAHLRSND